jgi:hypothetical protein
VLVGLCYAVALGLQLVKILLGVDPASLFTVIDQTAAGAVVEGIQLGIVTGCLLAGAVLLFCRLGAARGLWVAKER